ncbi:MAG: protein kinase domain-containing protein, partial [Pseudomonadota bacterium]
MTVANRGDRLAGRYLLVRRLGTAEPEASAARAQAWVAEDGHGTRVVLKLHPHPTAARREADAIAAFARAATEEPVAAAGLVRVLDVVELDAGGSALVLEYLPGGDLAARRGRRWTDLLPPLVPALAALARAHAAGLAHGDLKSANFVLDDDGRARLVDFGTAAFAAAPGRPTGSPLTRSPAQWRGEPPCPADDAYALGATLHELLTGFPPFYPDVTAARAEREPVVELHPRHPLPEPLVGLVLALLAKEPDARPSLADVRATLESLLAIVATDADESAVPLVRPPTPNLAVVPPPGAARVAASSAGGATQGATSGDVPLAGAAGEPATPRAWHPGTTSGPAPVLSGKRSSRWPLAIGGLLAAAAVGVFFALPRWVAEREPATAATGAARAAGAGSGANAAGGPAELPSDPAALAELARAKTAAEEARSRFREAAAVLARAARDRRLARGGGRRGVLRAAALGGRARARHGGDR